MEEDQSRLSTPLSSHLSEDIHATAKEQRVVPKCAQQAGADEALVQTGLGAATLLMTTTLVRP